MKNLLDQFDAFLVRHNLEFSGIIIGGAALNIMGVSERTTQDVDCIYPIIPEQIKNASILFARQKKKFLLKEEWFNNGPISLQRELPDGWKRRCRYIYRGKSLILRTLGRKDLLMRKLFVFCDRQQDISHCVALKPTRQELKEIIPWLLRRDINPLWPQHVKKAIAFISNQVNHGT